MTSSAKRIRHFAARVNLLLRPNSAIDFGSAQKRPGIGAAMPGWGAFSARRWAIVGYALGIVWLFLVFAPSRPCQACLDLVAVGGRAGRLRVNGLLPFPGAGSDRCEQRQDRGRHLQDQPPGMAHQVPGHLIQPPADRAHLARVPVARQRPLFGSDDGWW